MQPDDAKKELAAAIAGLKWMLSGLELAGVRDWPRGPGQAPLPAPGLPLPAAGEALEATGRAAGGAEEALAKIAEELEGCTRCRLHSGRRTLVFGEGSARSGLVFVGEGPGFEEDQQGRPFVGKAGKLLDKMIRAIGFDRGDVYICNTVKCRPPDNRTPLSDELETCFPFLARQIEALAPKVLCALGASAAKTLLGGSVPISKVRGKVLSWRGIPLVCTFHPAYLLRSPAQKAVAWQDLLEVLRVLGNS
jgi:uracil-DNA glycosylase